MGEGDILHRLAAHFQPTEKSSPVQPTEPFINRRAQDKVHAKLENQQLFFSNQANESVYFDRDDSQNKFLEPDLSSIRLSREKPLGSGAGFTVFETNSPSGKKVLKVEQVVVRKDDQTGAWSTHYPWMGLGMGQDRPALRAPEDAVKRREIHLEVKRRLEAVGIETANYIGSVVIPSKPLPERSGISAVQSVPEAMKSAHDPHEEATRRFENAHAAGQPPMYAEVWENPGGKMLGASEKTVEKLYQTAEGRASLVKLAESIAALSQQGYLYDVDQQFYTIFASPKTKNGYPYPRNFFVVNADKPDKTRFVAIDFNLGVDLTKQPWWKPEFAQMPVVKRSSNGQLYPNWELQKAVEASIESKYTHLGFEEVLHLGDADKVTNAKIERDKDIMESQAQHFIAQISVASNILAKVEEIEKRHILP